eukprot:CAMPEP_0184382832 /NCGR_PEP_ID=MMETSP0007-20130409/6653_1 /TAXON_ID=97485 /ORGANISM="Prymnesium parvum, Strain Texoma1" /LENGTH=183 /DNA_ID=CAMNT_0026729041 /DNA_START=314 /DNA_END=863 /DNA_ORIENTATION=+
MSSVVRWGDNTRQARDEPSSSRLAGEAAATPPQHSLLSALIVHVVHAAGDPEHGALHRLVQLDLTAEARGLREVERQVEHVELLLLGLGQRVEELAVLEDDVARRARERAVARALQVDVVLVRGLEHGLPRLDGDADRLAVLEESEADGATPPRLSPRRDGGGGAREARGAGRDTPASHSEKN